MKRVAKFQEGGNVEMTAAERRRQNIQRLNERRAANRMGAESRAEIERFNERMRQGTLTPDEMRRMGGRSDIERFSERAQRGQLTAEDMRRMGAEPTPRQPPAAPSMRDAVRPVAPGTPPRSPAESMRQAVRPVTPSGSGMRAPGIAGLLGAGVTLGGAALDAYRNRRPSGPYEQGMEPEGTPEATMPEAERNPPMPQVSGRSYDIGEGGTPQPAPTPRPSAPARPAARPAPRPAPRASSAAEDLNEIVLRLTRGEKPVTETEKRIADRMGIAYKKGGMVNKYQEGGRVRQGIQSPRAQEARSEMAEDVMKRARKGMGEGPPRRVPNSMLTPEEQRERNAPLSKDELDRMRGDAYKKGGMIKPKTAMKKGGAVATKKMKSGGKVAPKKMMKGGIVAKPKAKKMMGGGRAMYAKGGMTKGCK